MLDIFKDPMFAKFLMGLGSGMMGARTFGEGAARGMQAGTSILAQDLTRKQQKDEEEEQRKLRIQERQKATSGLFSETDYEQMPDEAKSMMKQGMGLLNSGDEQLMSLGTRLMTDANNYTQQYNKQRKLNNAIPEIVQVDAPGIGKISQLIYRDKDTGEIIEKSGSPILPNEYYYGKANATKSGEMGPVVETKRQTTGIETAAKKELSDYETKNDIFAAEERGKIDVANAPKIAQGTAQGKANVDRSEAAKTSLTSINQSLDDVNTALGFLDNGLTTGKFNQLGGDTVNVDATRKLFGDSEYEQFGGATKRLALGNLKTRLGSANLSNADVIYNTAAEGIGPEYSVKTNRDRLLRMRDLLASERDRKLAEAQGQTPNYGGAAPSIGAPKQVATTASGAPVYEDEKGRYVIRNGTKVYAR